MRARAEADEQRRRVESERYRESARREGYELWLRARPIDWAESSVVERYLSKRGIGAEQALRTYDIKSLRVIEQMRFMEKQGSGWECLAEVPAMIAAIQLPDGRFGGAHITWLDLNTDKGRLILPFDAAGKARPTKKVRGTQKGGAIRLYTPENATRIVMGEGIESTLSVMVHGFELNTAYWAGVNLGNMAGRAARDDAGKIIHDQPDMGDHDSFVPPSWCKSLIYLADGDSEESRITEKLTRGLRRAMRTHEGLVGKLVPAPAQGADMNDLAMQMARAGDV